MKRREEVILQIELAEVANVPRPFQRGSIKFLQSVGPVAERFGDSERAFPFGIQFSHVAPSCLHTPEHKVPRKE